MLQNLLQGLASILTHRSGDVFTVLLVVSVLWRATVVLRIYSSRPRHIPIEAKPYPFRRWFKDFDFILDGSTQILKAYKKLGAGLTFAIPSMGEYQILASDPRDIEAICNASEETLSFHEAMTDRLKHYYTIYRFKYGEPDPNDSIPKRVVKVLLRMQLDALRPTIDEKIRKAVDAQFETAAALKDDWRALPTFFFAKSVVEELNARVILGEEIGNKRECIDAALRYVGDVVFAAEVARQFPAFLTPIIAPAIMRWSGAMNKLVDLISPVVEERKRLQAAGVPDLSKKYADCIQWTVESSKTPAQRETPRLVAVLIGLLLASSHQMSLTLTYVLYALCDHPEYIIELRREIEEGFDARPGSSNPFKKLYLLESFLLEVARLNPPDALVVQRKVKKPILLPSGAFIPANNLVAVPQQALARNSAVFSNPDTFDGRRFLPGNDYIRETEAVTKFTDVKYSYMFWGPPRKPCPGRWYVSHTLKAVVVHLLMNYDMKLEQKNAKKYFLWTTAILPRPTIGILLRKKKNVVDVGRLAM
ncbi:cytochrome P450 [Trematosphaeria pertusa]|uniref:Cytochrome P450 n=1 Tax=Trematosphaeria pertusa TaxID=390896 RepID=A0A6A6HZ55_9PLEO|nr:cytochrome P450 [Trematosphaeria pertusa]KAF2242992.1 cytochrome P450 [Trematosphaeria pertusa]